MRSGVEKELDHAAHGVFKALERHRRRLFLARQYGDAGAVLVNTVALLGCRRRLEALITEAKEILSGSFRGRGC